MKTLAFALSLPLICVSTAWADDPAATFEERRAEIDWTTPVDAIAVAQYGIKHELRTPAAEVLIELLKKFPFNGFAKRLLEEELGYAQIEGEETKHEGGGVSRTMHWVPGEVAAEERRLELAEGFGVIFPLGEVQSVDRETPGGTLVRTWNVPHDDHVFQALVHVIPQAEVDRKGAATVISDVFAGLRGKMQEQGTVEEDEPVERDLGDIPGKEFFAVLRGRGGSDMSAHVWVLLDGHTVLQLTVLKRATDYQRATAKPFFESLRRDPR